jgi:hypothetical protein
MPSDHDRETAKRRSRRDLASRLLRPHLFFVRQRRAATIAPSIAAVPADEESASALYGPDIDVICCGMYRACSTWQYEVIAHLVEGYFGGSRLGYLTAEQYGHLTRLEQRGYRANGRIVRVLKSHEGDRVFARTLASGRALAVYAYRDVRDVVFSLAHKRKLTFGQLLRQGMIHQVLANDRFWSRCPNVLVQRYDDLLRAPADGVLELARHLGLNLERAEAERIAGEYSQESNRARTAALRQRLHQAGIDLDSAHNAQICDGSTLLHWNHMRDADSCWRSEASAEHEAIMNWLCGRWLVDHGYDAATRGGWWSSLRRARPRLSAKARVDLAVGRFNYLLRILSLRFPVAARCLKRLLGMSTDEPTGATAWSGTAGGDVRHGHESQAAELRLPDRRSTGPASRT